MKRKYHVLAYSLLGAALAAALFFGVHAEKQRRNVARLADEAWEGALLTAIMQMEDIQTNIDKALVSQDRGQNAVLLYRIGSNASAVHGQLSMLPLSHVAMADAIKLCNQISDYADALLLRLGAKVEDSDASLLESMSAACGQLKNALEAARGEMTASEMRFEQLQQYMQDADAVNRPLEGVSGRVEYPTLIYDGPFSDVVSENAPRGLHAGQISAEEACDVAQRYLDGRAKKAEIAQESGGSIPAWGVKATLSDCVLQLAVTKQGGDVLWMFPERAGFAVQYGLEECRQAAQAFLASHGYGDMQLTFWQIYGGMATLSYAAVQDGVLLYPDLVKVQVRMDTLQVVGVEARHYLTSHTLRSQLTPAISEEEARGAVSDRLQNAEARLCVIPQGGSEHLCWEFTGEYNGNTYYVFIDAHTGRQRDIQRLVQTGVGPMAE